MQRRFLSVIMALVMLFSAMISLAAPVEASAAAARAISIDGSNVVARGKSIQLKAQVLPPNASQKVTWVSSNEKIAKVSSKGKVIGVRAGKVKITAVSKNDPSVKESISITVKASPVRSIEIRVPEKKLDLNGKKTETLKAVASPSGAAQKFSWKSSNPKVAKVDEKGKVTAVRKGTAKITATAVDGSNKKKTVTITVIDSREDVTPTPAPDPTGAPDPTDSPTGSGRHFALLIGNGAEYSNPLYGPPYDVKAMKGMLSGTNQGWQITVKNDMTASGMLSAISSAFSGATENDVCLFYYSGHGVSSETDGEEYDDYQGALVGVDDNIVTGSQLASALNSATPGKVIVILDSCGSGSMIYSKDGQPMDAAAEARNFVKSMISSFEYFNKKDRQARAAEEKTGELLGSKFQVLAACEYRHDSLDVFETDGSWAGGLFTVCLLEAIGCEHPSGAHGSSTPADTNGDRRVTLGEAYSEAKKRVSSKSAEMGYPQVMQKSGDNGFVLFGW